MNFNIFRKKKLVIKAFHKGQLILMSYENPVFLRFPIDEIIGIDKIEVEFK